MMIAKLQTRQENKNVTTDASTENSASKTVDVDAETIATS
jgi:hypothetical protein